MYKVWFVMVFLKLILNMSMYICIYDRFFFHDTNQDSNSDPPLDDNELN